MGRESGFLCRVRGFARHTGANVAMMFGLSMIPLAIAAGAGLDFANAMMVRNNMSDALDAAALALGAQNNLSSANAQALAQNVFNANYKGTDSPTVTPHINGQQVSVTASDTVATTLLSLVGRPYLDVSVSTQVVWGQTKLWVALVLDNTGSMSQTDSTGTSKMTALKNASHSLLSTLQGVAANAGDVQVAIIPFAKDVKIGTSYVNQSWIDWTDWNVQYGSAPSTSVGPGDRCPLSLGCVTAPGSTTSSRNVPSSGMICPDAIGSSSSGQAGHYYDGCYNSIQQAKVVTSRVVATYVTDQKTCQTVNGANQTCTENSGYPKSNPTPTTSSTVLSTTTVSNYTGDSTVNGTATNTSPATSDSTQSCSTNKSGSKTTCTWTRTTSYTSTYNSTVTSAAGTYDHSWVINDHSVWGGCVMDRDQNDDTTANTPGTKFPAENDDSCPIASIQTLSYDWTALSDKIDSMTPNGGTNQTIGLAHGMQMLTQGDPYNPPTLPNNTTRYIILLSDGLNTMDRWYGDGSNQSSSVDNRMAAACTNAKAQGFIIYTVYVDLGGTQGNSTVLQNCATDSSKYYDLKTSGSIVTTFNQIAQQITNLRVAS